MYLDLSKAMHDAAARGTAHRGPIPAGPVLQRIHRRRAVRTATSSAVGVAAAGAVAFGGVQLAGQRQAAPPAGPSTSPSTAAPMPRSLPLPAACGTRLDDLPPLDLDVSVTTRLVALGLTDENGAPVPFEGDPVVVEGEEIGLGVEITLGPDLSDELADGRGVAHQTDVVAVAGGVVVGVADQRTARSTAGTESEAAVADADGTRVSSVWRVQLDECGPDGADSGEALVPGRYDLLAVVSGVETNGGAFAGVVISDPQPVEVVGVGTQVESTPDAGALPACGEDVTALQASTAPFRGRTSVQVGVLDTTTGEFLHEGYGDALLVGVTLVNAGGAPVHDARITGGPDVVIARDGVVVATARADQGGDVVGTWPAGDPGPAGELLVEADSCEDGAYLGAGEYVMWSASDVEAADDPGGPLEGSSVVHPPVTFQVYEFEDPDNRGAITWMDQGAVVAD